MRSSISPVPQSSGRSNTTMSPAVDVVDVVADLVDQHPVADLAASAPSTPTGCRRPGRARSSRRGRPPGRRRARAPTRSGCAWPSAAAGAGGRRWPPRRRAPPLAVASSRRSPGRVVGHGAVEVAGPARGARSTAVGRVAGRLTGRSAGTRAQRPGAAAGRAGVASSARAVDDRGRPGPRRSSRRSSHGDGRRRPCVDPQDRPPSSDLDVARPGRSRRPTGRSASSSSTTRGASSAGPSRRSAAPAGAGAAGSSSTRADDDAVDAERRARRPGGGRGRRGTRRPPLLATGHGSTTRVPRSSRSSA